MNVLMKTGWTGNMWRMLSFAFCKGHIVTKTGEAAGAAHGYELAFHSTCCRSMLSFLLTIGNMSFRQQKEKSKEERKGDKKMIN